MYLIDFISAFQQYPISITLPSRSSQRYSAAKQNKGGYDESNRDGHARDIVKASVTSAARSTPAFPATTIIYSNTLNMADGIVYRHYMGESDLPHIMALVQSELSEPYVVYTFRYFLNEW